MFIALYVYFVAIINLSPGNYKEFKKKKSIIKFQNYLFFKGGEGKEGYYNVSLASLVRCAQIKHRVGK